MSQVVLTKGWKDQNCKTSTYNHNQHVNNACQSCKCLLWQTCNLKLVEGVTIFYCVIVYYTMHNSFFQIITNDWSSSHFLVPQFNSTFVVHFCKFSMTN
jgi:hypothetical protein